MARADFDPYKLTSPRIFLLRMLVFVILAALVALILYEQIVEAFLSNPGLNGLIIGVLVIGVLLSFRQVTRLFPEIRWVNDFRVADPGLALRDPPKLLAPMAALLGDRLGRAAISTGTLRSILDSVGTRLDEARDIGRYLTGLLVFLGLLGTFWGLLNTVGSVGAVIQSLDVGSDAGVIFEDLKTGLAAPLVGMGIAFSSSLFGLAGSLILGFLELQASQAQNRFYNELEDWLSATVADVANDGAGGGGVEVAAALDRLHRTMGEGATAQGGPSPRASAAMAQLAEGIQGMVRHMRTDQQQMREWMESQKEDQREIRRLLSKIASEPFDERR